MSQVERKEKNEMKCYFYYSTLRTYRFLSPRLRARSWLFIFLYCHLLQHITRYNHTSIQFNLDFYIFLFHLMSSHAANSLVASYTFAAFRIETMYSHSQHENQNELPPHKRRANSNNNNNDSANIRTVSSIVNQPIILILTI